MGISVGGARRGTFTDINVVPLIDILLVLLVIFMVIPNSRGMKVQVPRSSDSPSTHIPEVVVQVLADGSLRLNQQPVMRADLRDRLLEVFKSRSERVAFVRGEKPVEF